MIWEVFPLSSFLFLLFFFFQAEDGIRDLIVTGVQTCALPIWLERCADGCRGWRFGVRRGIAAFFLFFFSPLGPRPAKEREKATRHHRFLSFRSEEHTSELQSRSDLVCRLLLEKKKKQNIHTIY